DLVGQLWMYDQIVRVQPDRYSFRQMRLEQRAVRLADHDSWNRDAAAAAAHHNRRTGYVVHHHDGNGALILNVQNLGGKTATVPAAIYQGDVSCKASAIRHEGASRGRVSINQCPLSWPG